MFVPFFFLRLLSTSLSFPSDYDIIFAYPGEKKADRRIPTCTSTGESHVLRFFARKPVKNVESLVIADFLVRSSSNNI